MSQLSATILQVKNRQSEDVSSMQMYIKSYFPNTAQALKIIDSEKNKTVSKVITQLTVSMIIKIPANEHTELIICVRLIVIV